MVNFNNLTSIINNVNWTRTSLFRVEIIPKDSDFQAMSQWGNMADTQNDIDICLKDVVLPQYSGQFNEELIAGKWHFSRATDKAYEMTMTFKDFDNATLYRKFLNCFQISRGNYSEKCQFNIYVYSYYDLNSFTKILETKEAEISDVSQITLSNENNEILEFSVSFKMNQPEHERNNLQNIQLNGSNTVSIQNNATDIFSNLLKNGLSAIQNNILNKFDKLTKSWD